MEVFSFVATIILVTGSGALAAGPLFLENLSQGARSGAKSGLVFSLAHTLVEFALVTLLALGLLTLAHDSAVKRVIGVAGGAVLIAFGALQIRGSLAPKPGESSQGKLTSGRLFLLGIALTGLNPFFIVWWLTAGAQLIMISLEFASFTGVVLMYVCHVWIDYRLAHGHSAPREGRIQLRGTEMVQTSHRSVRSRPDILRTQLPPQLPVRAHVTRETCARTREILYCIS
jgi:threonine/homoserine/homoserine lactone efflux protein